MVIVAAGGRQGMSQFCMFPIRRETGNGVLVGVRVVVDSDQKHELQIDRDTPRLTTPQAKFKSDLDMIEVHIPKHFKYALWRI